MMLLRVPLPMCVCGNVQCATPERVEAGASPLLAQLKGLGYAPAALLCVCLLGGGLAA